MPDESNNCEDHAFRSNCRSIGPARSSHSGQDTSDAESEICSQDQIENPWQDLLQATADAWPPTRWRDVGVVVGCSGGADSVALLTVLNQLRSATDDRSVQPPRGFLVAAHFHHNLRGQEADEDQQLVEDLAQRLGVRLIAKRSVHAFRDEASMRRERIDFLVDTAHRRGARYVVLAHSADDNVETVLHHLIRGTGPAGIAGIGSPISIASDLVLIRPFLNVGRQQIRDALRVEGQSWREDSSNESIAYRRNWIRHRLIPTIQQQFPQAIDAIARAIDGQRQWRSIIDQLADDWMQQHARVAGKTETGKTGYYELDRDQATPEAIVIAALQSIWETRSWPRGDMSQSHWRRLAETVRSSGSERYTLPGRIEIEASGETVRILLG